MSRVASLVRASMVLALAATAGCDSVVRPLAPSAIAGTFSRQSNSATGVEYDTLQLTADGHAFRTVVSSGSGGGDPGVADSTVVIHVPIPLYKTDLGSFTPYSDGSIAFTFDVASAGGGMATWTARGRLLGNALTFQYQRAPDQPDVVQVYRRL